MRHSSIGLALLAVALPGASPALGASVDFEVVANPPSRLYGQSTPLLPLGQGAYLTGLASPFGADNGSIVELVPPKKQGQPYSIRTAFDFSGGQTGATPNSGFISPAGILFGTTSLGGIVTTPYGAGGGIIYSLTPPAHGKGLWTETVLHVFAGCTVSPCDGASPTGTLAPDGNGGYYGLTKQGGDSNAGTIYSLARDQHGAWQVSVLYSFPPQRDSYQDYVGPLVDNAGNLYGSGIFGGPHDSGFVFKLAPPVTSGTAWTYSTLHQFTGGADGGFPNTRLIMDPSGALYGTGGGGGAFGGDSGGGVVYRLVQDAAGTWRESVLFSVQTSSGPFGTLLDLAQSKNGDLYSGSEFGYGTAIDGSDEDNGTIFRLAKPLTGTDWPLTVLHGFPYCPSKCPDGQLPEAITIQSDTKQAPELAGQTSEGGARSGGTVFTINLKP